MLEIEHILVVENIQLKKAMLQKLQKRKIKFDDIEGTFLPMINSRIDSTVKTSD